MADTTIKVHGLDELRRELRKIDGKVAREFGKELKQAAEPVVDSARVRLLRFRGASLRTVRAKNSGTRVFVEQSKGKVTGHHPFFGALQMRESLIPALWQNRGRVERNVERTIDKWTADF